MPTCDFLIIGSGIAGLSLGIKLANRYPDRKIVMVTKGKEIESNTRYAQGGISVVCDAVNDSFENHIHDTLVAGDGLCDVQVVESVIRNGPDRLNELIGMGVYFDRDSRGDLILGKEGGHLASRVVHFKDMTGFQIAASLLVKAKTFPNIRILPDHMAIDLITNSHLSAGKEGDTCNGALVLDIKRKTLKQFASRVTVLATGGAGQVYETSTNPVIATGDGVALAFRAGATITKMEFIQFHPTSFYDPGDKPSLLITEALRGYGAYLRNGKGERFMFKYHSLGELACRDVVARAIINEISIGTDPCVYVDCTHLPADVLVDDFPTVYKRCLRKDINITRDLIPVVPAAHYSCGGVDVNKSGLTSIENLYACGECAHTGLHGANRLASNSLLEAVVYAHHCYRDIEEKIAYIPLVESVINRNFDLSGEKPDLYQIDKMRREIQHLMTQDAGITRTTRELLQAKEQLMIFEAEIKRTFTNQVLPELAELKNLITCALLIVKQSLERTENRGVFYNVDLDNVRVVSL